MADFWAQFMPSTQQQTAPTPPQPTGTLPWWQQTTVPPPQPAQPVQPPQTAPEEGARAMELVQWAKQSQEACPNCNSSNYGTHPSAPKARARCFDCGFPLSQSGSGVTLRGEDVGPVKAARQTTESKTNSFNAQNIFHHLG
ncbi:hypothetical protein ACIOHC_35860 [Streptomyces sp. NPDC088252]|uniref:hypothetical protein n=1 Tax=Streptomyces sp. NPDC088252 TaxID=3365845 RepID=UPI0037F34EC1